MRVRDTIKIGETEFVVLELTIRQIIDYFQELMTRAESEDKNEEVVESEAKDTFNFFKGEIQVLIDLALEGDYKVEDFLDFRPSDLEDLYNKFKDVNKSFFDIAAKLGLQVLLQDLTKMIQKEFSVMLVSSSSAAIKKSLTTVTPTS